MEITNEIPLPDVFSYCLDNQKFRERWQDIYKLADEHIWETRLNCKDLFDSEEWKNGEQFVLGHDESDPKSDTAYKLMFNMILEHFDRLEHEDAGQTQRLSQRVIYDSIKSIYERNPKPFICSMCRFLVEEQRLLKQFVAVEAKAMEVCYDDQDQIIRYLDQCSKNFSTCIDKLESLEDTMNAQAGFEQLSGGGFNGLNATDQQRKQMEAHQKKIQMYAVLHQDITNNLQEIETKALEAENILSRKMSDFKKQLQLFYVDLVDHRPPIPTEVERGYSWLGQILYDILQYALPKLELSAATDVTHSISCTLRKCFERLLQSSFVVTEQQKHIIKVELGSKKRNKEAEEGGEETANQKFRCPKFFGSVRLLACDNIDCKGKVKAQFCNESEVNEKFHSGNWDSPCEIRLKAKTDESTFEKKKALASFKKMEIEKFERKPDVQVCEDKFRIVFTTRVKVAEQEIPVATISLPIVVTTGASQSCNVHGSLLWQCYSTENAFQLPIETANSLKWITVFDMLNKKMQTLGGRDLCNDEKAHLGSRLMLEENPIPDDMDIPFRRFCVEKMMDIKEGDDKKKSATFWMWFLAVFNLTKSHLRDYWNDGLIAGFIKKETAEQRLKNSIHPLKEYTYLLRFSDKVITDGQGQNLCGAISATVLYKNKKGQWKCFPTDPFKADTFKKKSLAQCVKNTCMPGDTKVYLLQWLYKNPTCLVRTEEAFEQYNTESKSKGETPGYKKFEEILIVTLNDMNLDEDSSSERKRDIKKAVPPSKKREGAHNRPGVIKNKRLSEPQREPNVYSDGQQHPSYSPMSLPPESPQMQIIPQTVLEFSGGESQDSMGSQSHTTLYQRVPFMQNSQQVIMENSTFSSAQTFNTNGSLSSTHPTLSGMLGSSNANNFQTIDENALGNTFLPQNIDPGFQDIAVYAQQQTSQSPVMYSNTPQTSPAPSMYSMQQPSPANSVHSLQSPDHSTQFVSMASTVYAPVKTTSTTAGQKPKPNIEDQMLKFQKLQRKIGGCSSESAALPPPISPAYSPHAAATLQSPPHQSFSHAASPAGSIQTSSMQSPCSQSMFSDASSPAGSVTSTAMEESVMESLEAILSDPTNKNELIENLKGAFNEVNSLTLMPGLQTGEFMS
ncbi:signal transducer and activator of transcription 5A-like [Saccostrea echinata]|uniref:signal transducer and activator of transcription 5A-like n=1 Tax=Saccostrea echinata TaxID=191078 RepID=UPI002A819BD9|nr:signal transducer and activator of transcription 5A-like [Saccostrea echinata]